MCGPTTNSSNKTGGTISEDVDQLLFCAAESMPLKGQLEKVKT